MNKFIKQAFTLIELLVVIAIIGILSGLIVVSMGGMTQKATIAKAQVFSNSLRNSLIMDIVGEWKFNEESGTVANDTWTRINNGNLTNFDFNTTTSGWRTESQCIFNGCLQFDGSNDWVDLDSHASSVPSGANNITVSAWVKWSSVPTSNQVIVVYGGNNSATGFLFQYENTYKMHMGIVGANNAISYVTPIANTWYYLVGTYNHLYVRFYINGVLAGEAPATANILAATTFRFGNEYNRSYLFNGFMDDVRLYDQVASTSQIKEQYYLGLNSLLANGNINKEEYNKRLINSLASK